MDIERQYALLLVLVMPLMAWILALPAYPLVWAVFWIYHQTGYFWLSLWAACLAYLLYTPLLLALIVLIKRLLRLKIVEGDYELMSWQMLQWGIVTSLIQLGRYVGNLGLLRSTPILPLYLKGMGAKVGKQVIINTVKVYDMDLLEIEDRAVIGGDAVIMAHSSEGRKMTLRKVKIGKGATIGQSATLLAGAQVGDGAVVGAMSVVPKNAKVPPRSYWHHQVTVRSQPEKK